MSVLTPTRADRAAAPTPAAGVDACFEAVAAFGLPGCAPTDAPPPADEAAWRDLAARVERARLTGPFSHLVASGRWSCAPAVATDVADRHREAMALTLLLERDLVAVVDDLAAAGIEVRVLKGSAVARLDEPDPSWRSFGDIDLLVRGGDLRRAAAVVETRGGHRRYAEPRPGFDEHFSKGSSFVFDRNTEVDLHRTLAAGPFGLTIDLHDLFAHTERVTIGDRTLPALDRPSRFLHACLHTMLGAPAPPAGAMRDIVRTAPPSVADCREVLDRATRWQVAAVVAAAVRATVDRWGWTPVPELAQWARWYRPSDRDRRWLDAYRGGHRSYAAQMINGIEAVPGVRAKVAYALALTAPAPAPGRAPLPDRWSRGLRALRRTLPR